MARHQEVRESVRDFQSELDQRNTIALNELNRQIDELATIPLRDLDPFMDSIDYMQPYNGLNQKNSPVVQKLTSNDLKSFQKDSFLDSKLDSILMPRGTHDDIKVGQTPDNSSVPDRTINQKSNILDQNLSLNGLSFDTRELLKQLENQDLTIEHINDVDVSPSKSSNPKKIQEITIENQTGISIERKDSPVLSSEPLQPKMTTDVQLSLETLNLLNDLKNPQYEYFGLKNDVNKPPIESPLKDPIEIPSELPPEFFDFQKTELSKSTKDLLAQLNEAKIELGNLNVFEPTHVTNSPLYSQLDLLENDSEYSARKLKGMDSLPNHEKQRLFRNDFSSEKEIRDHLKSSNNESRLDSTLTKNLDKPKSTYIEESSTGDNSRAIINALRTLQDRVGKLEAEKQLAKEKITTLEDELSTTRTLLFRQQQLQKEYKPQQYLPKIELNGARYSNPAENTLCNIADARAKIEDLKSKVDVMRNIKSSSEDYERKEASYNQELDLHLEKTAEGIRSRMKQADRSSPSKSENMTDKKNINMVQKQGSPVQSFNSLNQSQKPKSPIKSFASPEISQNHESPTRSNLNESIMKQKEAVQSSNKQIRLAKNLSPQKMPPLKPKNAFLAQDEINRLKMEIENEREVRRGKDIEQKSSKAQGDAEENDTDLIKKKLVQRLWLDSKQKSTDKAIPAWKTRSKSVTNSGNFHVRRRAPIEVPGVLGDNEESGKREMPFIVGRNAGKSFSVTANLQRVFSMLKSHNPELCSVCSKKKANCNGHKKEKSENKAVHYLDSEHNLKLKPQSRVNSAGNEQGKEMHERESGENLFQMLGLLESEFKDAKNQYNQLVRQYESVTESLTTRSVSEKSGQTTLKAIGDDLRNCIQTMETKSDQINIIRDIMGNTLSHEKKRLKEKENRKKPIKGYTMETATSRSRSKDNLHDSEWRKLRTRSQSPGRAMASLSLLKSTFKVQDVLNHH